MQESISFDKDLREAVKETVTILSKAVKSTLGPSGTNVGVLSEIRLPVIVNDGVTVAKQANTVFKDPLKKYIANILKTISQNTDKVAGDGTTTATTIAEAIILGGIQNIEAGFNQIDIAKGIGQAAIEVLKQLEEIATPVEDDPKKLLQVATISANNDKELGKLISEAFVKVGVDGQIQVEDSDDDKTYVDKVEGVKYGSGYESNIFVNTSKGEVQLEECSVLIYEGKLKEVEPLGSLFRDAITQDYSVLIIADDYTPQAMNDLTFNKVNAKLKVCAVRSPEFGEMKEKTLEDIADVTGAKIISSRFGSKIENFTLDQLGDATSVIVDSESFTIINEEADKAKIDEKIEKLKADLKKEKVEAVKDEISDRIAKLSNGVAVLYVSGKSPVEIAEKKYRIEDAINATRASLEEGIVAGGGVTLLRLGNGLKKPVLENRSQDIGFDILVKALEAPIRTICENCAVSGDVVINDVLKRKNFNYGYNAKSHKYQDLIKAGVIDPVKVTKAALTNAASVSQMLLTMNCAIYE